MPFTPVTASDPVAPLENVLNTRFTELDNSITAGNAVRAIHTFKWANAAARNAQTGMSEGDIGDQLDTDRIYRYSGTAWVDITSGNAALGSGTITAAASFNIDGLTGFNEYEITIDLPVSSTANQLSVVQLRNNGTPDTSANYDLQRLVGATTTAAASGSLAQTSWTPSAGQRQDKTLIIRLFSLNQTTRTSGIITAPFWDTTGNPQVVTTGIKHRSATAFNGIGFATDTGTVTGWYTVRGIR